MGRSRRQEVAVLAPNSMVAAAARLGGRGTKSYSKIARSAEAWQAEAWRFYRLIGEYRYSCDWVGSMLSKATLHATYERNGKVEQLSSGPAFNYVNGLFGETDGKTEMLRLIGIHMTVAGECYIVAYPNPDSPHHEDIWQVVAVTRLSNAGTDEKPLYMVNGKPVPVEDHRKVLVVRIWRQDPEDPERAISPSRAVLTVLGEIFKLTEHVNAQVDSRLAGAGILLVSSDISLPAPPEAAEAKGADDAEKPVVRRSASTADDLMHILNETMATAIEDRGDASALVPIVITAPSEAIDKVKHLTFWTELDEKAIELRNEAIRRLGLGMDMPPEILQGVADTNHWSAWQADESAIKSHTEPLLKIVTAALAEGFLRPLLMDDPAVTDVVENYSIRADTAEMRVRPNRSKEALELYQMGMLNRKAVLRETGFDPEADAMSENEEKMWLLRRIASGSTTPDQVAAAFAVLFKEELLPGSAAEEPAAESTEARPQPSLREHPVRDVPDQERSVRRKEARERGDVPSAHGARTELLATAADQLVIRALERAGNRLKSDMKVKPAFAAVDLYKTVDIGAERAAGLLTDAWAHVPRLAERFGLDADALTVDLDTYTAKLLCTRAEHSYERLLEHLTGELAAA